MLQPTKPMSVSKQSAVLDDGRSLPNDVNNKISSPLPGDVGNETK